MRTPGALRLGTLWGLMFLAGCTDSTEGPIYPKKLPDTNKQQEQSSVIRWKLPKGLREISGLAIDERGSLYAVADEQAAIYRINPLSGKIESVYALGRPTLAGDFEGIALHDNWLYLITSDGKLVRTKGADDGEVADYELFRLPIACELEGLAADPERPLLWLVCKSFENNALSEQIIQLHAWSITAEQLTPEHELNLELSEVLRQTSQRRFKPSGIAFLPDEQGMQLLVISGAQRAYARWQWGNAEVQFIDAGRLPKDHKQAEGVEIAPDGGILIADEGGKGSARLRWYAPGELF